MNPQHILKDIDINKPGSCMISAELMAQYIIDSHLDSEYKIVEGYVKFPDSGSPWLQHTWLIKNNQIIDPTVGQFKVYGVNTNNIKYKIKSVFSATEYINLCNKFPVDKSKWAKYSQSLDQHGLYKFADQFDKEFQDDFYQKYVPKVQKNICTESNKICYLTKTQARNKRREKELRYNKILESICVIIVIIGIWHR